MDNINNKKVRSMMQLYRQTFEKMPVHIYWKDNHFRYIYCNLLHAKNIGLVSPEEIIGKTDYDLFPKKRAELIRKNDIQVITNRKPYVFEEPWLENFDKNIVFLTQKMPLFNDKGEVEGLAGISLDITERKAFEEEMSHKKKEMEQTLASIIDNLPGHVYWKDKQSIFLGCNCVQAKSAGFETPSDLIGRTDYEMPWKGDADNLRQSDLAVMESGETLTREEISLIANSGQARIFLSKKAPLRGENGEVAGVLGISFDITDRKNIEKELEAAKDEAEEANYLMTEFISNMGHDLATPISDVGSVAEVLKYYADEYAEMQDLIETLIERAAACEAVRKKIINATSISNLEVKKETFSIIDELLVLEKELRPLIGSKSLKIILKPLKPKKEDFIKTDRKKFHDILSDLISNAINFTEEGEVSISVFKKDNMFHIKVSDTGIGIPKDKFEYIFKQYTKLSRSNKHGAVFKGVGAGLYLARIRAHILNATISVESKVNKGSTFTLVIPR